MTDTTDTAVNSDANSTQQDDKTVATKADTISSDTKTQDTPEPTAGDTKPAEDWRVKFAGGDEKELKRLARFATEADVFKAYRELEKKKSSGELKAPFPQDGTAEEIAAWRKDNGIPESADKYELNFDNGLVIGENDKPLIDKFVTKMHGENASPAQVKAAIASYYDIMAEQQQAIAEADVAYKDESLEALREDFGGDFKKNINAVTGLLQSAPEGVKEILEASRTPDGKILGNHPDVIKWLANIAFEINPAATVMPNSVSNPGAAINDEIATLEKMVGDRGSDYWKGPSADKNQARYRELLSARDKIAAKS